MTEQLTVTPFRQRPKAQRPYLVPSGFKWVVDAVELVGEHLFPGEWTGKDTRARDLPLLPSEAEDALKLRIRAGKRKTKESPDGQSYVYHPLLAEYYDAERLAAARYQSALKRIRQELRGCPARC